MARNEPVFVYPGGARETLKRTTDEKYQLFWEGRNGFAAMAIRWGATIIPVVSYGSEHFMDIVADLPLGWVPIPWLWGSDRTLPLISPRRPERLYFEIGDPIETARYGGDFESEPNVAEVKAAAQAAVQSGLERLAARRELDYPSEREYAQRARSAGDSLARYIRSLVGARL